MKPRRLSILSLRVRWSRQDVVAETGSGAGVEDGGGDVVSDGDGALDADDRGYEWHVVGKHGRVTTGDGGGVEGQAEISSPANEVRTC